MKELKLCGESIVMGQGAIEAVKDISGNRVFIVIGGESMIRNGALDRVTDLLKSSGKSYEIFKGVPKNPDTHIVEDGIEAMKAYGPDTVLAMGGGSPIDAAKVMAVFYEYPELNFGAGGWDTLPQKREKIHLVAVPTTSGTGTEVTRAAVITFRDSDIKIGLKSNAFIPDLAILDPELTLSMPDHVVAETGLDALTHAVECYMNHGLDDFTECLAVGAIEGLMEYLPLSYRVKSIESREKVHHYQCLAGMAFHNVGLGLSHGISHAIGGRYDLGHGLVNGIILPYAVEFNRHDPSVNAKVVKLEKRLGIDSLEKAIYRLNAEVNLPGSFEEAGLTRENFMADLDLLIENGLKGSTRGNPRPMDEVMMRQMLLDLFEGIGRSMWE